MAATTVTREAIRTDIMEWSPLGDLYTLTAGSTTSVTDDQELKGPHPSSDVPRGSPIRLRDATTAGTYEDSFSDVYTPSTGQITLEPDITITAAATDKVEIWLPEIGHVRHVDEIIDQILTEYCGYWHPFVLTLVTDGDMETATADVATYWENYSGTPTESKVDITPFPHRFSRQALRIENSAANDYVRPTTVIYVEPGDTYRLDVLARAAVSTLSIGMIDETNVALITLDSSASSTVEKQWVHLYSTFTIPSGCYSIRPILGGASSSADTYWTALSIVRIGDRRISLPDRISNVNRIGRIFHRRGDKVDAFYRDDVEHPDIEEVQEGHDLILHQGSLGLAWPLYAEEWRNYDALSTDTATTTCEIRYVRTLAIWQLYHKLWLAEESRRTDRDWVNKWAQPLTRWAAEALAVERAHAAPATPRIAFPQLATRAVRI